MVDQYIKVDTEQLMFLRSNQDKLRVEHYSRLQDAMRNDAEQNPNNLGTRTILPSSHVGSPRDMMERCQDALRYCQVYGSPDLFITMTANPRWDEVQKELAPGQGAHERQDIVARVFRLKVNKLKELIFKDGIFRYKVANCATIEWQKKGLPHIHLLVWLQERFRLDDVDGVIYAEIPDREEDPKLYDIVSTTMIYSHSSLWRMENAATGSRNLSPR